MVADIAVISVLLLLSASFSSLETALFSLSPLEKKRLRFMGALGTMVLKVLERPGSLLTSVLFGNELVNVAISILVGGFAYRLFQGSDVHLVYTGALAIATFFILVFGEIVPKNVAIRNRMLVSQFLVLPFRLFSYLVTPLRFLLEKVADWLVSWIGVRPQRRMIVEEEFQNLLEMGRREGTLADLERTLIQNALDFSDITVAEIMTPRQKIFAVPETFSIKQVRLVLEDNRYSRVPVYRGNPDDILGILHAKRLVQLRLETGDNVVLEALLAPHADVRPDQKLPEVFEEFRKRRLHMGIVKGPDGGTVGLVTMDDLLRRLFP